MTRSTPPTNRVRHRTRQTAVSAPPAASSTSNLQQDVDEVTGSPSPEEYEIGYGRPPQRNQFKRGQSGNPKGRPPRTKNYKTVVARELDAMVNVREGGITRQVTAREAIVKRLKAKALDGDHKAISVLIKIDDELEELAQKAFQDALHDDTDAQTDRQIFKAMVARIREKDEKLDEEETISKGPPKVRGDQ